MVLSGPKIQLGLPEVQVGLLPGGGGTQRLPRLAGLQAAGMAIMMGQPMSPQAALAQNVVNEVVPAGTTIEKAKEWVKANPKAASTQGDHRHHRTLRLGFGKRRMART